MKRYIPLKEQSDKEKEKKTASEINQPIKDAITKLFHDYFKLDFNISYFDDSLAKMSPGKRALVLLKILIYLSDDEYPILIDQPESDLDNRSVYIDLVKFIKEKSSFLL